MVTLEEHLRIDAPVEHVFEYLSRFENDTQWRTEVTSSRRTTPTDRGIGERYEQQLVVDGQEIGIDFEVTDYDPNRRIGFRGTAGDLTGRGTYEFAADGASTEVSVRADIEVSGALQATEPYIRNVVGRTGREDFDRLRELLETEPPPAT
jgi:uncharacterized membrane protein